MGRGQLQQYILSILPQIMHREPPEVVTCHACRKAISPKRAIMIDDLVYCDECYRETQHSEK